MKKIVAIWLLACIPIGLIAGLGIHKANESSDSDSSHADVQVIEDWAAALKAGDVEQAASYFAIPSVVSNATAPIALRTQKDAIAFNTSLPCGATVLKAVPDGDLIDVTFRLTDRPGGACGSGAGGTAGTAFKIEDGKITQWKRLPDVGTPGTQAPTGPIV